MKTLLSSLSLILLLSACQSANVITGNSLIAIGAAENASMTAAAKAEVAGTISLSTWNDIAAKHALFLTSYDLAVQAAAAGLTITNSADVSSSAASVTNSVNSAIPNK